MCESTFLLLGTPVLSVNGRHFLLSQLDLAVLKDLALPESELRGWQALVQDTHDRHKHLAAHGGVELTELLQVDGGCALENQGNESVDLILILLAVVGIHAAALL